MPIAVANPKDHAALLRRAADSLQRFTEVSSEPPPSAKDDCLVWYFPIPFRAPQSCDSSVFGKSPLASFLTLERLLIEFILKHARPHCARCDTPTVRGNPDAVINALSVSASDTFVVGHHLPTTGPTLGEYLELLQRDRTIVDGELIMAEMLSLEQRQLRGGGRESPAVILQSFSSTMAERPQLREECRKLLREGFSTLDIFLVNRHSRSVRHLQRITEGFLCNRCQSDASLLAYADLHPHPSTRTRSITIGDTPWSDALASPLSWWAALVGEHAVEEPATNQLLAELRAATAAGFGAFPLTWDTRNASFSEGLRLGLLVLLRARLADATILVEDPLPALPASTRPEVERVLAELGASDQQVFVLAQEEASSPSPSPHKPRHQKPSLVQIPFSAGPSYKSGELLLEGASVTLITGPSACGKTHLLTTVLAPFARTPAGKKRFPALELVLLPEKRPTRGACIATEIGIDEPLAATFAAIPESQSRGLTPGDFSLSTSRYGCATCHGAGYLPPVTPVPVTPVLCPRCDGRRFDPPASLIRFGDDTLGQLLAIPIAALLERIRAHPAIAEIVVPLIQAGFGGLPLGYPLSSLSLATRHRLRCVGALARKQTSRGALILLDMPYLGASPEERGALSGLIHRAADAGHTIVLAESSPDPTLSPDSVLQFVPGAVAHAPFELQLLRS